MKNFIVVFLLFQSLTVFTQNPLVIGTTTVVADTVYTGIDVPWEIIYGPDNHLWITERKGVVSRIDPVTKTRTVILDIQTGVYCYAEAGLLGMALHPDFPLVNEVFIVYTYGVIPNVKEKLVKYQYTNNALTNPVILRDSIPGTSAHNGSRLLFMPDKTLLMTTGDAHIATAPQSTSAINGKILRLNTNGTIPNNNPFTGSYTYSFGHRNTQGLTMTPAGVFYMSEHGTGTDDEFQVLEKGRNYGWPDVQGFCDQPSEITFCAANNVKEPIVDWSPSIAPSDLVYYENNMFPEFNQKFIMTTLKNKQLVAIQLNSSGTGSVSLANYLTGMFGRLRDICVGPNKEIYLATNGPDAFNNQPNTHSIIVLTPPTPTVGLIKKNGVNNFVIYPTITEDRLFIETEAPAGDKLNLRIVDLTGRICLETFITPLKHEITLMELNAGVYLVEIIDNGKTLKRVKIFKK